MPSKMHHIGLEVSDIARSEAFYVGLLDFRKVAEYVLADRGLSISFLQLGDVCLELLNGRESTPYAEAPPSQCGYQHLALVTDDVDRDVARLRAAGVKIRMEPADMPVNARIAFVEDPDGVPVELWQDRA